eukprot:1162109-Pelagomonas_calceolata.AAC.2
MSDSRKYTSVFPHSFQRSREQHYFGFGVRGHVRHHNMMLMVCSVLQFDVLVMYALQAFQNSNRSSLHDMCTCKHETSGALHRSSILQLETLKQLSRDFRHPIGDRRVQQASEEFHLPDMARIVGGL